MRVRIVVIWRTGTIPTGRSVTVVWRTAELADADLAAATDGAEMEGVGDTCGSGARLESGTELSGSQGSTLSFVGGVDISDAGNGAAVELGAELRSNRGKSRSRQALTLALSFIMMAS